jgi:hypothetical protein
LTDPTDAFEARIDGLLVALGEPGEDLAGLLVAWHGPAVRALAAALDPGALAAAAADPAVAAVLELHGVEVATVNLLAPRTSPLRTHTAQEAEGGQPVAFLGRKRATNDDSVTPCRLCGRRLDDADHRHAVDTEQHTLECICTACWYLLEPDRAGLARYRAVPDRVLRDDTFTLDPEAWSALEIPVSTAFFVHDSHADRVVALYPSPAGATESLLPLAAWDEFVAPSRLAQELTPDVEAIVARPGELYVVPIDACYELVGAVRRVWHGLDGGAEVRDAIDTFFADLDVRARALEVVPAEVGADG